MGAERRRLLNSGEAARFLGIHQYTRRAWEDRELVPHVRTPTGYRRFDVRDLERLLEEMRVEKELENSSPGSFSPTCVAVGDGRVAHGVAQ